MNGRGPTCALNVFSAANTDRIRGFKQVQTAAEEFTAELSGRLKSVFTPEYSPESEMIVWIYKNLDQTLFVHKTTSRLVSSFKNETRKSLSLHGKEEAVVVDFMERRDAERKEKQTTNCFYSSHHHTDNQLSFCMIFLFYLFTAAHFESVSGRSGFTIKAVIFPS